MLCWCEPSVNWFKLNIDGTRSSITEKIGAGGVFRDHLGSWVDGFQVNIGTGEILDAEAQGLFFGLKLMTKHSIAHLEIESESAILVHLMYNSDINVHPLGSLLDGCAIMMSGLQNVKVTFLGNATWLLILWPRTA